MLLKRIAFQNFRNYTHSTFELHKTVFIVGKNAAGKTNILEAIRFLSHGKSFRAEKELDVMKEKADFARIKGTLLKESDETTLTLLLVHKMGIFQKKYLVNDVPRRQ